MAFGYALELACAVAIVTLAVLATALLDYSLQGQGGEREEDAAGKELVGAEW